MKRRPPVRKDGGKRERDAGRGKGEVRGEEYSEGRGGEGKGRRV